MNKWLMAGYLLVIWGVVTIVNDFGTIRTLYSSGNMAQLIGVLLFSLVLLAAGLVLVLKFRKSRPPAKKSA